MKLIRAIAAFVFMVFLLWYSGLEILERGFMQAWFLGVSVCMAIAVYCFPMD